MYTGEIRERILTREGLVAASKQWQEKGLRLVLTNGLFDILHVGHIRYLEDAKRYGDILLVAINSDRSAKALKGEKRPIIEENDRAYIVAGIRCVDYVTIFDEENVETLIEIVKPSVHAKGSDYTIESVPEKDLAEELGYRIVIAGDPKDHASSSFIENVINNFCKE